MEQQFCIGEYVVRRMDNEVGIVKKVEPYTMNDDGDFMYYVRLLKDREDTWAGTTRAWRRYVNVHAHVTTSSRDCDGQYSAGHTDVPTTLERCSNFGDLEFKDRVVTSAISLIGTGTLEVTPQGVSWHEQTEEGYRTANIVWCEDNCTNDKAWQRDHSAEAAGY